MIITFCGHSRIGIDAFCKKCAKKYKALYGIRCKTVWNQAAENAPSVIPCAYGDAIHADA